MDDYCPNRERIGIQALSFRGELLNFRGVFFFWGGREITGWWGTTRWNFSTPIIIPDFMQAARCCWMVFVCICHWLQRSGLLMLFVCNGIDCPVTSRDVHLLDVISKDFLLGTLMGCLAFPCARLPRQLEACEERLFQQFREEKLATAIDPYCFWLCNPIKISYAVGHRSIKNAKRFFVVTLPPIIMEVNMSPSNSYSHFSLPWNHG